MGAKEGKNEVMTEEERAELAAEADSGSKESVDINDKISFVVGLHKPYRFEGKEYERIDLGGLRDLTTMDLQELDRIMERLNYFPRRKFEDTTYTKHAAMLATGLPVEFFNGLSAKDMSEITARVRVYFLY